MVLDGQADAPLGHISFTKVKFNASHSSPYARFTIAHPNGSNVPFQVTMVKTGSKMEECMRLARICYLHLEQGKSKEEVLAIRNNAYEEYAKDSQTKRAEPRAASTDKAQKPDDDKSNGVAQTVVHHGNAMVPTSRGDIDDSFLSTEVEDLNGRRQKVQDIDEEAQPQKKRKKDAASKSSQHEGSLVHKLQKRKYTNSGKLKGAVQILGRSTAKKNYSINGVYTLVPRGFEGHSAYQKVLQARDDPKTQRFLFYSENKRRWKVSDSLNDDKGGFAYCKSITSKAPTPGEINEAVWCVFDGKKSGYNEDAAVKCRPVNEATGSSTAVAISDDSASDSGSDNGVSNSQHSDVDVLPVVTQGPASVVNWKPQRAAAKMMVRCGLRCPKTFKST